MPDPDHRNRLADLLEMVAEGSIDTAEALREVADWPSAVSERSDVSLALNTLMQAYIYRDVRATDPVFDEDMKHRLRLDTARLRI